MSYHSQARTLVLKGRRLCTRKRCPNTTKINYSIWLRRRCRNIRVWDLISLSKIKRIDDCRPSKTKEMRMKNRSDRLSKIRASPKRDPKWVTTTLIEWCTSSSYKPTKRKCPKPTFTPWCSARRSGQKFKTILKLTTGRNGTVQWELQVSQWTRQRIENFIWGAISPFLMTKSKNSWQWRGFRRDQLGGRPNRKLQSRHCIRTSKFQSSKTHCKIECGRSWTSSICSRRFALTCPILTRSNWLSDKNRPTLKLRCESLKISLRGARIRMARQFWNIRSKTQISALEPTSHTWQTLCKSATMKSRKGLMQQSHRQPKMSGGRGRSRGKSLTNSFCTRWLQHKICNRHLRMRRQWEGSANQLKLSVQATQPISSTNQTLWVLSRKSKTFTKGLWSRK